MEPLSALDTALTGKFRRPDSNAAQPTRPRLSRPRGRSDTESTLRYTRSDKTALYVRTREGDIVRLRIDSRQSSSARTANTEDGERLVAETRVRARSAQRVSLSVKGDLHADELAALGALFEQAGALAERFFAGELPSIFTRAADLELDPEQIATVALRLRSSARLTYTGPERTAPTSSRAPVPPTEDTPEGALFLFRAILDYLTGLIDDLERIEAPAPAGADGASPSIEVSLKLELFASIVVTLSEAEAPAGGEAPATDLELLPAVVDAIVERSEHLDALA